MRELNVSLVLFSAQNTDNDFSNAFGVSLFIFSGLIQ